MILIVHNYFCEWNVMHCECSETFYIAWKTLWDMFRHKEEVSFQDWIRQQTHAKRICTQCISLEHPMRGFRRVSQSVSQPVKNFNERTWGVKVAGWSTKDAPRKKKNSCYPLLTSLSRRRIEQLYKRSHSTFIFRWSFNDIMGFVCRLALLSSHQKLK